MRTARDTREKFSEKYCFNCICITFLHHILPAGLTLRGSLFLAFLFSCHKRIAFCLQRYEKKGIMPDSPAGVSRPAARYVYQ